jgi:hypothetical protein
VASDLFATPEDDLSGVDFLRCLREMVNRSP